MFRSSGRAAAPMVLFSSVALLFACSSSSGNTGGQTGGAAVKPANVNWCPSAPAASGCGNTTYVEECGVCIKATPSANLTRTTDTKEYFGSGAPDLACDSATAPKPLGTSKMVSLEAWVKIFANGPDSKNVRIDVYKEQLSGGQQTGQLGEAVGNTTSVDALPDGTTTKQETIMKSGTAITRTLYPYRLDNVPTETPLVVKTSSKTSVDVDGWFALYDFNIILRNDDPTCGSDAQSSCYNADGTYRYFPRALGNDDYTTIVRAAYSRAPAGGKGAVAGEVHDCGDVRLSNATVGLSGPSAGLGIFYLSEDEDNPVPDLSRKQTGRLGLYAFGELDPGTYSVAASGKDGSGTLTGLGNYTVQTFPDSVSVFTFRGLRAWQVASK
jgi:hypothetical protein